MSADAWGRIRPGVWKLVRAVILAVAEVQRQQAVAAGRRAHARAVAEALGDPRDARMAELEAEVEELRSDLLYEQCAYERVRQRGRGRLA